MRLSEWRTQAPVRDALGAKVTAVIAPVLGVLDVEADPHAWVQWGDDAASRYTIFVPTSAGLVSLAVRVNPGGAGPRATAKIIRWSRLQLGEFVVETEGPHRMVSFQLESAVLRGADEAADGIGRFALIVLAAVEGRPWPSFDAPRKGRAGARASTAAAPGRRAGAGSTVTKVASSPKPRAATPRSVAGDRPAPRSPALTGFPALPPGKIASPGRGGGTGPATGRRPRG